LDASKGVEGHRRSIVRCKSRDGPGAGDRKQPRWTYSRWATPHHPCGTWVRLRRNPFL